MRSTSDKSFLIFVCIIGLLLIADNSIGLRISRPITLKHPLDERQVRELNNVIEEIFNMQEGRFEFDVAEAVKTNARNGEVWILKTGNVSRIQFKANDQIFTLIPNGV